MKHFIANQILKPAASFSFAVAASATIVMGFASVNKVVSPKQEIRQVIDYCSDLGWAGVFTWLGTTALAQMFGGFEEESEAEEELKLEAVRKGIMELINESPEVEPFDYWTEIEKHHDRLVKEKCSSCQFYCGDNDHLNCAVHPELLYCCPDFRPGS